MLDFEIVNRPSSTCPDSTALMPDAYELTLASVKPSNSYGFSVLSVRLAAVERKSTAKLRLFSGVSKFYDLLFLSSVHPCVLVESTIKCNTIL